MELTIFTDLHYASIHEQATAYFKQIGKILTSTKSDYLICLGDINTEGNKEDLRTLKTMFDEHKNFKYVFGNHDTMLLDKKDIQEIMGVNRYYKVQQDNVVMLMLDSVVNHNQGDWSGHVDLKQCTWLKEQVSLLKPDQILLVMSHHPLKDTVVRSSYDNLHIAESETVWNILKEVKQTALFFNGHNHMNDYVRKDNWHFIGLGDMLDIMAYLQVSIQEEKIQLMYHPIYVNTSRDFIQDLPHYRLLENATNGCTFEDVQIEGTLCQK